MNKKIFGLLALAILTTACSSNNTDTGTVPPPSPTATGVYPLTITPTSATVAPGGTVVFTVSGGIPPYSYLVASGPTTGSCDPTGHFTAVNVSGTVATLQATDAAGSVASAIVTTLTGAPPYVGGSLTLSPSSQVIAPLQQVTFTTLGGTPPYNYLASGGGSFSGNVYTAPSYSVNPVNITVTDATGLTGTGTLSVQVGGSSGVSVIVNMTMTPEGTHQVGGLGLPAGFTVAGSVADADNNIIYGDQLFYTQTQDTSLATTVVSDIQVTQQGLNIPNGPACPDPSYLKIGTVGDWKGQYVFGQFVGMSGSQSVCVHYQAASTAPKSLKSFYVTQQGLHKSGGPNGDGTCNPPFIVVGASADCGGGSCYGSQLYCAQY